MINILARGAGLTVVERQPDRTFSPEIETPEIELVPPAHLERARGRPRKVQGSISDESRVTNIMDIDPNAFVPRVSWAVDD
jgi:hypothetical protein